MESTILVKIFATAFALSEVLTHPGSVRTHLDPAYDQEQVVQVLRGGCDHMRRAFDIETINIDDLISTALNDPEAFSGKAFHGINFGDLNTAYHQFCKNEAITRPVVDLGQVIEFYNAAAADLPDPAALKDRKLPSASTVLDGSGQNVAEVFEPGNRRIWLHLADIPEYVRKAAVAAEDRRFFEHPGIDERGIIRAFIGNLGGGGRPQGGSSITQQVVKNLLVGDDVSYERKIREMIVASRLEATLSKDQILELYLNSAYFGRGSWGVEMAARGYFGKSAKDLTLGEAAMLAGMLKGPNYFDPERHADRAKERLAYVLGRMQEDGVIDAQQKARALAPPKVAAFTRTHRDSAFQFVDFVTREARGDGIESLTAQPYTVHSTINAQLQRDTESALQEGLAQYEASEDRTTWRGPEANLGDAIQKLGGQGHPATPDWLTALKALRMPLYDVHWTPAVVLQTGKNGIRVGLPDGRTAPLSGVKGEVARALNLYDVVYARVGGSNSKNGAVARLRLRPTVQGATLVLENKTGRILAMAGSFSYPLSQLNRTWQTERQPGSTIKPVTYLTALEKGLQPNTLVLDEPITLPPIGGGPRHVPGTKDAHQDYFWTPRNADHGSMGTLTLRRGLEYSRNLVTAHLLDGGIESDPAKSLDDVCATAMAAKIYSSCLRYYPFVLGAQPARMINLAAFYAAIAQEGVRPQPHSIDSIESNGQTIYEFPKNPDASQVTAAERASHYQLKTILQGVVARGTARSIASLSPYVAGKTGTTEDAVDGWFIGFTNDVTVAVWVGYDNNDRNRRSLGSSETGGAVALPIFEPIIELVWAHKIAPKAPLSGPSPEAQKQIVDAAIDYSSGDRLRGKGSFVEHFRRGADNEIHDTQYQVVSGKGGDKTAEPRKLARKGGNQQADGRPAAPRVRVRETAQARNERQVRSYYNYWQPTDRSQNAGFMFGDHYP